jgi:glycosyltransferase involved in cell wall biosynthesis
MGLPVIYVGPQGSNVDEAISRFGCGISLRPGDAEGMVVFIRACLNDPSRRQELRRHAREAFDQAYCDRVTLPQFDRILGQFTPRAGS